METVKTYRRLVKPEDMNPAGRLYGGRVMEWLDEATALYVMCQLKTKNIVTLKITELVFKKPVICGDILEFKASLSKIGKSSVTVDVGVWKKNVELQTEDCVLTCQMIFVKVDAEGKAVPHGLTTTT